MFIIVRLDQQQHNKANFIIVRLQQPVGWTANSQLKADGRRLVDIEIYNKASIAAVVEAADGQLHSLLLNASTAQTPRQR